MKDIELYDKEELKCKIKYNKYKERLQQILSREDTVKEIKENMDELLLIIPEIKKIIGFKHKHPRHHLDVWPHTLEVIRNLNTTDIELNMAGLLHDISKSVQYQDDGEVRHYHGHPEVSYEMTKQILSRLNFDEKFIDRVSYLVLKHDTPIDVNNLDNTYEMIQKLLKFQYADARAHHPDTVGKRIRFLDKIKNDLEKKYDENER